MRAIYCQALKIFKSCKLVNEDVRSKYAAYSDCIICDNWQCYQAFRKWYDDNFYNVGTERMQIDKDILYKNNRVKYLFIEKEEMN